VVKNDGSVWAWGDNTYSQLGNISVVGSITNPVQVAGISGISTVAAGWEHSLALKTDGTVWAWGDNYYGQVGDPYNPPWLISSPYQVKLADGTPINEISSIASGCAANSSYAVQSNGTVWAWGANGSGQLGNGGQSPGSSPVPSQVLNLAGVISVAAGQGHALAVTTNGWVYAWGDDTYGQLGNGGSGTYDTPILITSLTNNVIVAVAAGQYNSYALDNSGNIWEWGRIWNGTQYQNDTTPVFVSGLDPTDGVSIIGIAAGYDYCLAEATDGSIWAWGENLDGAFGNGMTNSSAVPVHVSFVDGTQSLGIAAGTFFSLSIQSDGTVRSWGSNHGLFINPDPSTTGGQLGRPTGAQDYLTTPGPVGDSLGGFTFTGSMNAARQSHAATLLANGQVLVAGGGGTSGTLSSAELYDPAAGSWTLTAPMNIPRVGHTTTLLNNNSVLAAGGNTPSGISASAELFDPVAGIWTLTGSMNTARELQTATSLPNGQVLVAGGWVHISTAELYDPVAGAWTLTAPLNIARYRNTATLLNNGLVLVAGGYIGGATATARLYNPTTGTWTSTGSMNSPREDHTATLLPNGKVLVAGGINVGVLSSAELYDPSTGQWTLTGSMSAARANQTATLLSNGQVLVAGGHSAGAEIYDPSSGMWVTTGSMNVARTNHSMNLLPNGQVLVTGGTDSSGNRLSSAELYSYPVIWTWY
jgi:alpha-tubulin suppressor-like RCC1 family protein